MTAYFITAVGTGIGKTFTTCALLHAAKTQGMNAHGYKPIISGWNESDDTDTAQIILANGIAREVTKVSPWRFKAPLSPHMAAPKEGKNISLDTVVKWTREHVVQPELTLIETVGGVMVPLNDTDTTLDWMREVALPVVLVTGSYLGSISHTLTALELLRHEGLEVHAIVINESEGSSVDFHEATTGLMPFIRNIPLQIFQPRVSSWREANAIHALLAQL
jgi:dethiobiotin synthetase